MYGLKEADKLVKDQLITNLIKHHYAPSRLAPNIWTHHSRPTKFILCVDDFAMECFTMKDTQQLLKALKESYEITID